MEDHVKSEKKPVYKKWWFWVIAILLIFMYIGSSSNNTNTTTSSNETNNTNTTTTSNETNDTNKNIVGSISKEEENTGESSKYQTSFKWECTGDIRHEGKKETEILAIESDEYNGVNLESGKYRISYTYHDYTSTFGLSTTNKYNRCYFVYIANQLTSIDTLVREETGINNIYTFAPTSHDEQIIQLNKGQYIYVQHTEQKEAGDGTIKIEKIKE